MLQHEQGDRTASLLRLSLEEGFFLAYALEILTIHNIHDDTLIGPVGLQVRLVACKGAVMNVMYLLVLLHQRS